jgi:hypothetical protein
MGRREYEVGVMSPGPIQDTDDVRAFWEVKKDRRRNNHSLILDISKRACALLRYSIHLRIGFHAIARRLLF